MWHIDVFSQVSTITKVSLKFAGSLKKKKKEHIYHGCFANLDQLKRIMRETHQFHILLKVRLQLAELLPGFLQLLVKLLDLMHQTQTNAV